MIHYQRDDLWSRLVQPVASPAAPASAAAGSAGSAGSAAAADPSQFAMSPTQYEVFKSLTFRRPLAVAETSLGDLSVLGQPAMARTLWRPLIAHILRVYQSRVRQFVMGHHHHLVIVNPQDKVRSECLLASVSDAWVFDRICCCMPSSPPMIVTLRRPRPAQRARTRLPLTPASCRRGSASSPADASCKSRSCVCRPKTQ